MDEYYSVIQFLPEPLRTELKAMPPERAARVQEIRLRAGQAVQFTVGGAWQPAQQLLPAAQTALAIGPRMLRSCFAALCRDSAYAYEDELKQGYFTLPGGSRVGVAGVCGPAGFADITSLNLRVARQVPCVLPPQLRRTLDALNGGILVVGTPGSGKTTFLRSIIRYLDTARRIFCVADERGELLTAGHTVHCDVYTRCTKAQVLSVIARSPALTSSPHPSATCPIRSGQSLYAVVKGLNTVKITGTVPLVLSRRSRRYSCSLARAPALTDTGSKSSQSFGL